MEEDQPNTQEGVRAASEPSVDLFQPQIPVIGNVVLDALVLAETPPAQGSELSAPHRLLAERILEECCTGEALWQVRT